jgi:hypothetical protein
MVAFLGAFLAAAFFVGSAAGLLLFAIFLFFICERISDATLQCSRQFFDIF